MLQAAINQESRTLQARLPAGVLRIIISGVSVGSNGPVV
jgi:hypothetical protein